MRSAGKRLRKSRRKSHDWLSLVFICLEKALGTRLWRSGFLLFLDRPRFCGLMKTRDRRYLRSSSMNGDESGEAGAFLFSRRAPDFSVRWSAIIGDVGVRRRWISLITNSLNCWAPVPQSQIIGKIWDRPLANIRYIGKIWDGRQKVKSPIVFDFPDILKPSFMVLLPIG